MNGILHDAKVCDCLPSWKRYDSYHSHQQHQLPKVFVHAAYHHVVMLSLPCMFELPYQAFVSA